MFDLNDDQVHNFNVWLLEHDKKCKYAHSENCGAIGGRLTYKFTPTSLGIITTVDCVCGDKCELTDFDNW